MIRFLFFFLIPLLLVPGLAFADSATTDKYQNGDGSTTLIKYLQPRVYDGEQYRKFIFTETSNALTVETQHGSVSLDKNTCGFSYFKEGKLNVPVYDEDGNLIGYDNSSPLFTDSIIARRATNGTDNWIDVNQVNNASCVATWNGKELTATKTHAVGQLEYKYILSGGVWKTQLEATNTSGLNDQKFGFTQTIDLNRDTIHYGGSTKNLDNFHGQTFDRTWLENNQGKVINLLNGFHYDFDLAFENLWSVTVYDTGLNKSKLAFDFTHDSKILYNNTELILDPQFTGVSSSHYIARTLGATGSACPSTWDTISTSSTQELWLEDSATSNNCRSVAYDFPIDDIPSTAEITNVTASGTISIVSGSRNCDVRPMAQNGADYGDSSSLWTDIHNGSPYLSNDSFCASNGAKTLLLGSSGISDLQTAIDNSETLFSFGMHYTNETRDGSDYKLDFNDPTLSITYNSPPDPPKLAGATQSGSEPYDVTFTWSSGENNGYAPTFDYIERLVGSSWVNIATVTSGTGTATWTPTTTGNESFRVKQRNVLGDSCYQFFIASSLITSYLQSHLPFCYTTNDNGLLDNDGIITGSELYTTQNNELGFDFDGSNYITLPNESDYDFETTDPFSLSLWTNFDSLGTNMVVLSKGSNFAGLGYFIYKDTANNIVFRINTDTPQTNIAFYSSATLDTWYNIIITFSGNSNQDGMKIYVNGILRDIGNTQAMTGTMLNNNSFIIGADSGNFQNGQTYDVMIFDKELSQSEITQLYNEYIIISQASTIVTPELPAGSTPLHDFTEMIESRGGFYFGLPFFPLGIMLVGALATGRTVPIFTFITLALMGIVHASGFYVYPAWFWAMALLLGTVLIFTRTKR